MDSKTQVKKLLARASRVITWADGLPVQEVRVDGRAYDHVLAAAPGCDGCVVVAVVNQLGRPHLDKDFNLVTKEIWGCVEVILACGKIIHD